MSLRRKCRLYKSVTIAPFVNEPLQAQSSYQLRHRLQQTQSRLKNQLRKLTDRPTLRWIFQCFQAIHLLQIAGVEQVSNLTDE